MALIGESMLEEVRRFLSRELSVPLDQIERKTRLGYDLGVDGDDAAELLAHFAERFSVDLREFPYDHYFGPEGFSPALLPMLPLLLLGHFFRWFLDLAGIAQQAAPEPQLTVDHLAAMADVKRWIPEPEGAIYP